jgi:hypothetical protein
MSGNDQDEIDQAEQAQPESGSWMSKVPTWFGQVRAEEIKERKEREDRADDRVDGWAQRSLEQAEKRAEAAEKSSSRWMYFSGFLILVVCVLAGKVIGLEIPGLGKFTGGEGGIEVEVDPSVGLGK